MQGTGKKARLRRKVKVGSTRPDLDRQGVLLKPHVKEALREKFDGVYERQVAEWQAAVDSGQQVPKPVYERQFQLYLGALFECMVDNAE